MPDANETTARPNIDPSAWRARVERAIAEVSRGNLVIVTDDEDRENEGDLVLAAQDVTTEAMAFIIRHTSGIVCTPMSAERVDALGLRLMVEAGNNEPHGTAFTVSVDHIATSTGVSAADRAETVRRLADPATNAAELRRPGHIFPLRARDGGVLKRAGHTEAADDLMRLAGKEPVSVISEITNDDGSMARSADLARFAATHGLHLVAIADLVRYRRLTERLVERTGAATIPTAYGEFKAIGYRGLLDGAEHLALCYGTALERAERGDPVLVRVHSECLTGDVLGSLRCDCGEQLAAALEAIAADGAGILVYLRGQEGRGIGIGHKLRAYSLQEAGLDTVDANVELGLPVDSREYGTGAQILTDLGVHRLRLITNNPSKYSGLRGHDLEIVDRVGIPTRVTRENFRYLLAKQQRLGHHLDLPDEIAAEFVPDCQVARRP